MSTPSLRREAGATGLLFSSIGGMIGSGWLFSALNAAKIAGPAAVISWIIGGLAVLLLAFVYAELSTMFPRPGAVILFPQLCFGDLAARIMSWVNFLAYMAVPPVEAVAVVSYAANFWPGLAENGVLTSAGIAAAAALMALFTVINLLAIRAVLAVNNIITWWKLLVPAATIVALAATAFNARNFTAYGFAPGGAGSVFSAVSGSGIIFTYLGFRQAIELAGESANPHRNLPFAIIGSVLFCMLLYVGLQIAFIGALPANALAHGWAGLNFPGISGPFAGLAAMLGLGWLAAALYADAAISPAGAGIIYSTTAARVVYAGAESGLLPRHLGRLSAAGVPWASLGLAFAGGLLFLLPLPSWRELVSYISSIGVLAYGVGPVALACFRATLPEAAYPRPFRLAAAQALAPLAFCVGNLVVFWAGAVVVNHLFALLALAFATYCGGELAKHRTLAHLPWRGAAWLLPHFSGLWLITYLGPVHGRGLLGQGSGAAAIILLSLIVLALARRCAIPDPQMAKQRYGQMV
jgi:amino acid transporter